MGVLFQRSAVTSTTASSPSGDVATAMCVGSVGTHNQLMECCEKGHITVQVHGPQSVGTPAGSQSKMVWPRQARDTQRPNSRKPVVLRLRCSCSYCIHVATTITFIATVGKIIQVKRIVRYYDTHGKKGLGRARLLQTFNMITVLVEASYVTRVCGSRQVPDQTGREWCCGYLRHVGVQY